MIAESDDVYTEDLQYWSAGHLSFEGKILVACADVARKDMAFKFGSLGILKIFYFI